MRHADLIAVVANGAIAEVGTFEELMAGDAARKDSFRSLIEGQRQ
jgi:ABC-type multidrug transport system fused ATPase/permease subunit